MFYQFIPILHGTSQNQKPGIRLVDQLHHYLMYIDRYCVFKEHTMELKFEKKRQDRVTCSWLLFCTRLLSHSSALKAQYNCLQIEGNT